MVFTTQPQAHGLLLLEEKNARAAPLRSLDRVAVCALEHATCSSVAECYKKFYRGNAAAPVGLSTLGRWWLHWEQYGELPVDAARRIR